MDYYTYRIADHPQIMGMDHTAEKAILRATKMYLDHVSCGVKNIHYKVCYNGIKSYPVFDTRELGVYV